MASGHHPSGAALGVEDYRRASETSSQTVGEAERTAGNGEVEIEAPV